ncbi:MAG: ZIP family metal transporter [Clostridia bacterium]|nr:ZIP family metal transporter [Clostridia bacterium]
MDGFAGLVGHPALWGGAMGLAGAGLGGMIGVMMGKPRPRLFSCLINATGGLMLAVSCFDLLPQAYMLSIPWGLMGLLLGVAMMLVADLIAHRYVGRDSMRRTGLLVALGIALHNLPEGLAIGSGYAEAPALGITLGALIALHDIPEGIAMAVPLRAAGMGVLPVLGMALLSGLPTGLGAYLGLLAGGVSQQMIALCLGLAGGAMLQITAQEMIPSAGELYTGWDANLMLALGVAAGSVVTLMLH